MMPQFAFLLVRAECAAFHLVTKTNPSKPGAFLPSGTVTSSLDRLSPFR
jgi:hypothetical protein